MLASLAVLASTGFTYQTVATEADHRNLPPPGRLYDVGGFKMHIACMGQGSPTVILEALSGGFSSYWNWIQPQVATQTRVCAYDRAGFGWSEPDPQPLSLERTARNLHTLLQQANIAGPFIMVGHSIGGLYVRKFSELYPEEVTGLVLLDSSHPNQFQRHPDWLAQDTSLLKWIPLIQGFVRLGLGHAYFAAGGEMDFRDLPAQPHAQLAASLSSPDYWGNLQVGMNAAPEIFGQAQALGTLGDLPLLVVSRGEALADGWGDLQNELARLSTDSTRLVISGATHSSLIFNPLHARQVSAAILQMVATVRAGQHQ